MEIEFPETLDCGATARGVAGTKPFCCADDVAGAGCVKLGIEIFTLWLPSGFFVTVQPAKIIDANITFFILTPCFM